MQNNLLKRILAVAIIVLFIGSNFVSGLNIQLKNIINPLTGNCIKTFYVSGYGPDNYTGIQDAINDANDGDMIFVYNSIYYKDEIENYRANIDKDINIIEIDTYGQVLSNNINFIIDAIRFFKIERNKTCINTFFEIMKNIIIIMTYRQKTYNSMHIIRNSNPSPTNSAIDQLTNPKLSIKVNDYKGHKMNVTFSTNVSGIWEVIGSNNSVGNGTYSHIPSNMYNYNTKYWWSVNTSCSKGFWCNNTYCFTTSAIKTSVNIIIPYNQTTSPLEITATGPNDLSNVTLYYRYNKINFTYNNYITSVTKSDVFKDGKDSNYMDYPNQMIVRDGIGYIVSCIDDSIVIVNGTNSSHLSEISHRQDRIYLNGAHDIDITNDSKYAYVISFDSPYLCMYNITNKTSITRVNQKYLTGEKGMYLDLDDDNNFLYATTNNYVYIYNVTDKYNYQLDQLAKTNKSKGTNTMLWHPLVYKDTLYVADRKINQTVNGGGILVYNVTNKLNPIYIKTLNSTYQCSDESIYQTNGYTYFFTIGRNYSGKDYYSNLICYNISSGNSTNPTFIYCYNYFTTPNESLIAIAQAMDIRNNYVFIDGGYAIGVNYYFINITNINNPLLEKLNITNGSPEMYKSIHEIEFDENGSKNVIYLLSEPFDAFITLNLNYTLSGNVSDNSTLFIIDFSYPWSWSFNFPNSTGYYEFYSIGKKIGNIDETPPHYPDTSCHFSST